MTAYVNSPLGPRPILLVSGLQTYVIGSLPIDQAQGRYVVTNVALTTNVATVTVQIIEGPIPAINDFITIVGTANTSGLFNVDRAPITAVSINQATGEGTISFALTHANVTSAADNGMAYVEAAEQPESITANYTSRAVTVQFNDPNTHNERTIAVDVNINTNTSLSAKVALQGAMYDNDAEYVDLPTATYTGSTGDVESQHSLPGSGTGGFQFWYNYMNFRFYRVKIYWTSGSATLSCAIMG